MTLLRIFVAVIYSLISYSASIAFVVLKNNPSAVLALITGVVSSLLAFLHILYRKGKLQEWYNASDLRQIARLAYFITTIGVLTAAYFIALEVLLKKAILPIEGSYVLPIIWSIITIKSALLLLYFACSYQNNSVPHQLLNNESERNEENVNSTEEQERSDEEGPNV